MVNTTADPVLDARSVIEVNTAYTRAKVLQSAVEIGLFELLAGGARTEPEIRAELDLHERLTGDFLDALTAMGFLLREGGAFGNSPLAQTYLVAGEQNYVGGTVARAATHNYAMWGRLTEALRDGKAKSAGVAGPDAFRQTYQNPEQARRFLAHMDANNSFVAGGLAESVPWQDYDSFLDLGGARGNVAAELVRLRPHLRGGVFDLPDIEPYFAEHMRALGTDRVRFHGGDFFAGGLPGTDVAIFGHVLHDWAPEIRAKLLKIAFDAVNPGGLVVVYDQMIDDERFDVSRILQSINVRLVRDGGSEFTASELRGWAEDAGFAYLRTVSLHTVGKDSVFIAQKPRS
jgi:hypothetical protein